MTRNQCRSLHALGRCVCCHCPSLAVSAQPNAVQCRFGVGCVLSPLCLARCNEWFPGNRSLYLHVYGHMVTVSADADKSADLSGVRDLLRSHLKLECDLPDLKVVKEVATLVVRRAARLSAAAVAAVLVQMKTDGTGVSVGIDGSVFKHHPSFKSVSLALEYLESLDAWLMCACRLCCKHCPWSDLHL